MRQYPTLYSKDLGDDDEIPLPDQAGGAVEEKKKGQSGAEGDPKKK